MKLKTALAAAVATAACLTANTLFAHTGREITLKSVYARDDASVAVLGLSPGAVSDGDLYVCTGDEDGGDATNGWRNCQHLGCVRADETTLTATLPPGFGTDYTHFRFFLLYDGTSTYTTYPLTWLESTVNGGQYVDTDVEVTPSTLFHTRMRVTLSHNGDGGFYNFWVCGISGGGFTSAFVGYYGNQLAYGNNGNALVPGAKFIYGHKVTLDADYAAGSYTAIDHDNGDAVIHSETFTTSVSATATPSTLWLFGWNGERKTVKLKTFAADYWVSGVLVRSLRPVSVNGVGCFIDLVARGTDKRYYECGHGTLTKGEPDFPPESSSATALCADWMPSVASVSLDAVVATAVDALSVTGCISAGGSVIGDVYCRAALLSDGSGEWTKVIENAENGDISFDIPNLTPNRTYFITLEFRTAGGDSVQSETLSCRTPPITPDAADDQRLRIARMTIENGVAKKAVLAFPAGQEGCTGALYAAWGDSPSGADDSTWAHFEQLTDIGDAAGEYEYELPAGARYFRFSLKRRMSDLYDHLVESLTSDGVAYIDTGVTVTPDNFADFHLNFTLSATAESWPTWNVWGASGSGCALFAGISQTGAFAYGNGYENGNGFGIGKYTGGHIVTFDYNLTARTFTVTDLTAGGAIIANDGNTTRKTPTAAVNLWLFGWNCAEKNRRASTLYNAEIRSDDAPLRKYHPCVDKAGVACLYDEVTRSLVYNANETGSFTPGAATEVGEEHMSCDLFLPISAAAPNIVSATAGTTVRGVLSQFGGESASDCSLAIRLSRAGDAAELRQLGQPADDGSFSFALADLVSNSTYAWELIASSSGGADVFPGTPFLLRSHTTFAGFISETVVQSRVDVSLTIDEFGEGDTLLYVMWGDTPENLVNSQFIATLTKENDKTVRFSFRLPIPDRGYFYSVVASNLVGTAFATSTRSNSRGVLIQDRSTYTWKPGVSGRWCDPACWSCNLADNWGYPNAADCLAVFPSCTADVALDGDITVKMLSLDAPGTNLRLHGTDTNACRIAFGIDANYTIAGSSRITLDRVAVTISQSNYFGVYPDAGTTLTLTNSAILWCEFLRAYEESRVIVCDGSVCEVQDFQLGDGELVLDNATLICQCLNLNAIENKYDKARALIRGSHPRIDWRLHSPTYPLAANISRCRPARLDFEIPAGGYAETPLVCTCAEPDYPFGDADKHGASTAGTSTNIMVRVTNPRGSFSSLPEFQPLITWEPTGIMTNRLDLLPMNSRRGHFEYVGEGDHPTTLGVRRDPSGMAILVF